MTPNQQVLSDEQVSAAWTVGTDGDAYIDPLLMRFARAIESATLAALAQQAQEPVDDRYFSYSTDMGFEEFATQQEAIDCSNVQINGYRDDAIRDDEWPDEVDSVCWGVILGRSKEIDTSNEDHESVDYKLYTTPPAPQVPAPVDERAEFEASMREKHGWVARDFQSDSFGYFDGHTATAWLAWRARASLQTKGQP